MYKTVDRPSITKGTTGEAEVQFKAKLSSGELDFERVVFEKGDFPAIAEKIQDLLAPIIPESTPEKIETALVGALNSYQTGLVRSERFNLVEKKVATAEAPKERINKAF